MATSAVPVMGDRDKPKQALIEELKELGRRVKVLESARADDQGRSASLEQARSLAERIKELNCLFGISHLAQRRGISLEEIAAGTVNLIPPAWKYPEITCARIIIRDQEFRTQGFRTTRWKQAQTIVAYGDRVGAVEVFYLKKMPASDEGPFLREERDLLDAIAERLGRITELKETEESLRESEECLRTLVYSMEDFVFLLDDAGKFKKYYQPADKKDLYAPPTEFLDKHFRKVLPKHVSDPLYKSIAKARNSGRTQEVEYFLDLNNRRRWYEAKISPILVREGVCKGFTVVARDITERKKVERMRVEAERLKTIGTIAAEVAHEIRNPIVSIGGFARRLQQRFPDLPEAEIILREAERLERMLERIWEVDIGMSS